MHSFLDGELNVLEDILTDAPDQDDELYNPESEHDINEKKGTRAKHHFKSFPDRILFTLHNILADNLHLKSFCKCLDLFVQSLVKKLLD